MIKQINEFIDWPVLVEKLSPTDREVYEAMKSECKELMASESPNHEEVSRKIRAAQEFLITNPSLDPGSARELWRSFLSTSSLSNDNTEKSKEKCDGEPAEKRLELMYKRRAEKQTT